MLSIEILSMSLKSHLELRNACLIQTGPASGSVSKKCHHSQESFRHSTSEEPTSNTSSGIEVCRAKCDEQFVINASHFFNIPDEGESFVIDDKFFSQLNIFSS